MRSTLRALYKLLIVLAIGIPVAIATSCEEANDHRIPAYAVSINLTNLGVWNTYGVSGVGMWNTFILEERIPVGFPYTVSSRTGFGGVLLVGVDAGDIETSIALPYTPMAYDLACPVEVKPYIRIHVDESRLEGVCDVCGSRYSLLGGGYPTEGPAKEQRYWLSRYRCKGSPNTGYMITY